MRRWQDLTNKRILILGLGTSGQSVLRFLLALQPHLHLTLAAADSRATLPGEQLSQMPLPVALGSFSAEQCTAADMLVVSPGIAISTPAIAEAKAAGVAVLGDIELFALFFNEYLADACRLVVVTGSNGKSSVVTLIGDMLTQAGQPVQLGGNIGQPALDLLLPQWQHLQADAAIVPQTYVLELSSFQLETTASLIPDVACLLNVTEDHLDRYRDFDHYAAVKQRIYHRSKHNVFNADDGRTQVSAGLTAASCASFATTTNSQSWGINEDGTWIVWQQIPFLQVAQLSLVGQHNVLNVQAAAAIASHLQLDHDSIKRAAIAFAGLPHRCQIVSQKRGINWVNDSKATNVGATIAAILSLRSSRCGRLALIAGGDSKGADLEPLRPFVAEQVGLLVAFGKDGALLGQLSDRAVRVAHLQDAVVRAAEWATPGDWVLLSPACASLDMFDNYAHRGECFVAAVEALV